MTYDCFPFFNELDLLEIRLNELSGVVDRFVLAEAELTHNGDRKPLYFDKHKERFAKFADKIIHIIVKEDDFSVAGSGATFQERAWMRENIQRNAISRGLANAKDDDLVIVSDLDELPRSMSVTHAKEAIKDGEVLGFILNAYNFYANLRNVSDPFWGNDPKMATVRTFRDAFAYESSPYSHFVLRTVNEGQTATRFRFIKPTERLSDAGWHFSYLGGAKAAVAKVRAFNEMGLYARANLDEYVEKRIAQGKALFGGDHFLAEALDQTFPAYLLGNREKFAHLIVQHVPRQGVRMLLLRRWFGLTASVRRFFMRILFALTPKCIRKIAKRIMGIET